MLRRWLLLSTSGKRKRLRDEMNNLKSKFKSVGYTLALITGFSLAAHATTVVPTPVSKIATTSTMIVDATVVEQSVWQDASTGRIYTSSMLQVHDWIHGAKPQSLVEFRQLGGEVGSRSMWIPGAYRLNVGERVVLLGLEHQGTMISWGIGQGKFTVQKEDGVMVAAPSFGGVEFVEVTADGSIQPSEPDRGILTLDALKAQIKKALNRGVAQ